MTLMPLLSPGVIWFTGFSGSGKTTIAKRLVAELAAKGQKVEFLDGDVLRAVAPTGFSKQDRDNHIRKAGQMASELEKKGAVVVASFVSPYAEARGFVRGLCRRFAEVHVSTPIEVCEKRDVKGLYAKARRGEIKNFTGLDDPYEAPKNPELVIDTSKETLEQSVASVLSFLESWTI